MPKLRSYKPKAIWSKLCTTTRGAIDLLTFVEEMGKQIGRLMTYFWGFFYQWVEVCWDKIQLIMPGVSWWAPETFLFNLFICNIIGVVARARQSSWSEPDWWWESDCQVARYFWWSSDHRLLHCADPHQSESLPGEPNTGFLQKTIPASSRDDCQEDLNKRRWLPRRQR